MYCVIICVPADEVKKFIGDSFDQSECNANDRLCVKIWKLSQDISWPVYRISQVSKAVMKYQITIMISIRFGRTWERRYIRMRFEQLVSQ